jgi:hypothetical protein
MAQPSASDRLQAARTAAAEGRHAEALTEFIWFHHHALEETRSLYGVRLSFALGYWMELAAVYRPALIALEQIRDEKTEKLLANSGDRDIFHDVASINDVLGTTERTHLLFSKLHSLRPGLAKECATLAMPAIVASRDFSLAAWYLPNPESLVRTLAGRFLEDIQLFKARPGQKAAQYDAFVHIFADEVRLVSEVLAGIGRQSEALRLRDLALELIGPASHRKAVRAVLEATEPGKLAPWRASSPDTSHK